MERGVHVVHVGHVNESLGFSLVIVDDDFVRDFHCANRILLVLQECVRLWPEESKAYIRSDLEGSNST